MKKVLIVAYHFPPSNAVGALRPAKFAEYLPEFGWEPIVLAGAEEVEGTPQFGPLDGVDATRVGEWAGPRELLVRFRGFAATGGGTGTGDEATSTKGRLFDASTSNEAGGLKQAFRRLVLTAMWVPDDRQGWIPPALGNGLQAVRQHRPDVIYVTSPPASACLAATAIARICGLPLVCDFRDPWCGNPFRGSWYHGHFGERVDCWLEARVLAESVAIITATEAHAASLRDRHSLAEQVQTIENGFDTRDFEGLSRGPSDRFTITYAGNLYHNRSLRPVFDALAHLRDEASVDCERIRIQLIGARDGDGYDVRAEARAAGCEEVLDLTGRLPYRETLGRLVNSDMLLLLANEQPEQVPTKAYEYLAAGPTILTLGEQGATGHLIERSGRGSCYSTRDIPGIADCIETHLSQWEQANTSTVQWSPPPGLERWDRYQQTRRLADIMDACIGLN